MSILTLRHMITPALLVMSIPCVACTKNFMGQEFLLRAHNKGIAPNSTCFITDLPENSFYAFPSKECSLVFSSTAWLTSGWKFIDIEGKGRFSVVKQNGNINITIEKKGGFTLKRVLVSSELKADECKNSNLADAL